MSTFRIGDRVTVRPPYDSPHVECAPHMVIAGEFPPPDPHGVTHYRVTACTMRHLDGSPMLFGPYPPEQLTAGWDERVARLR
ncbi:hypothetical protein FHR83_003354 [Actinoplanes campanulatus]|uniref:Uncharacterized protein n=1 Tax=Actinoplanes campanulatus TaxID=113559 RepID=A0A7W5AH92_9ACTN|nr:hypothetical protein [Actinoplanes campanulatus]MBB3095684.1 hypothetical protein [Actinoplanes campanulatus]GGN10773.1 hypothetical protein GCM10010109_20620 [Actinoplanes campanulatus]GID36578.1 hypothetical protein Aca09nite_30840 [Actinoplanes campanulatus]